MNYRVRNLKNTYQGKLKENPKLPKSVDIPKSYSSFLYYATLEAVKEVSNTKSNFTP